MSHFGLISRASTVSSGWPGAGMSHFCWKVREVARARAQIQISGIDFWVVAAYQILIMQMVILGSPYDPPL